MSFKEYISQLEASGELKTLEQTVSSDREIAAICRREFRCEGGGSALLFKSVTGSPFPVAANLFGSEQRAARLLHSTSFDEFSNRVVNWLKGCEGSATERFEHLVQDLRTEKGVDRLVENSSLADLPALKSWPQEGSGYFNLAVTLTQHPDTQERNLGLYRAQVIDESHLALNFAPKSGTGRHLDVAKRHGLALPVCLLLGHDPALLWTAAAPLPEGCDELQFYQSFFKEKVNLIEAKTQPLKVPDFADIMIEGEILADETTVEGPYGNHTGYYVSRPDCPILKVTKIRYCPDSIVPQTVVGPPPSENIYLGMATEILIREMVKIDFPQIRDVWMPHETMFHGAAVIAVGDQSVTENKDLIHALWRESPLSRSRFLLLVDERVHRRSLSTSWWCMVNGLSHPRIYSHNGQTAIDATDLTHSDLVKEDQNTIDLLAERCNEYQLW